MINRNTSFLWFLFGFFSSALYYFRKWESIKNASKNLQRQISVIPAYTMIGEVKHIFLYAIDDGHPIQVDDAFCLGSGLRYRKTRGELPIEDRSFVVYTEKQHFSYLGDVKLPTVRLSKNDYYELETMNGGKKIKIENDEINRDDSLTVDYLNQKVEVYDCGDRAARFLSEYILEKRDGLRLGKFAGPLIRKNLNWLYESIQNNDVMDQYYLRKSLAPEFNNFSLISNKTIDFIKGLEKCEKVTPEHLRVHIVIELNNNTAEYNHPFIEDRFVEIKIGSASFTNVKLRSLARSANIDPQTGIMDKNCEPYHTLQRVRPAYAVSKIFSTKLHTPIVGINMEINKTGVIRVGDKVYVQF